MKKTIIYILLLLAPYITTGQQLADDRIHVSNVICKPSGNTIEVSMDIDAAKANINKRQAILITPVITNGNMEQKLPALLFAGNNRLRADKRAIHFGRTMPYDPATNADSSKVHYRQQVTYQPWMANATILIREDIYACNSSNPYSDVVTVLTLRPAITVPAMPAGKPSISYIVPNAEMVKSRNVSGTAYLDFPAGKSIILTDFSNNFKELSSIRHAIENLLKDTDAVLDSITMRGYASPEGSYATNNRLSLQRSTALKNYLQHEYPHLKDNFSVSSVAEDWEGLKKIVESANLNDRDAALIIISSSEGYDVRERKLKSLKDYPYILKEFFSRLRRVEYRLNYAVRAFTIDEGKEKIKTNPGSLSLNEMFLVANTYPKGGDDFNNIFDIAVRMYPADIVANLNAGATALQRGDTSSARKLIIPYAFSTSSWNNLGILYLLEGDLDKANEFLTKAKSSGSQESVENLALLEQWKEYVKAKNKYETDKKTYGLSGD